MNSKNPSAIPRLLAISFVLFAGLAVLPYRAMAQDSSATPSGTAEQACCWIDVKTGKQVPAVPLSGVNINPMSGMSAADIGGGSDRDPGVAVVSDDRKTAVNTRTKQNFARMPCPPPTEKKSAESQPQEKPEKTSQNLPQENNIRQFDFFAGYAFMHAPGEVQENLNGWNLEFAANLHRPVGVVADFSGHYGSTSEDLPTGGSVDTSYQRHLFLVGPQFAFPEVPRVTPFAHLLLGAALGSLQTTVAGTTTDSSLVAFAMGVGGGVDFRINSHVDYRLIQTDYVLTNFGGAVQNNFRLSTGVVVKFGKPMEWK